MKKLLLILALFVGNSFAEDEYPIHLNCLPTDGSSLYEFSILLNIKTKTNAFFYGYDRQEMRFGSFNNSIKVTPKEISFVGSKKPSFRDPHYVIDRSSGKMSVYLANSGFLEQQEYLEKLSPNAKE